MEEHVDTVKEYSERIEEADVKKAVSNILKRAQLCVEVGGGAFEYKMKKSKSPVVPKNEE